MVVSDDVRKCVAFLAYCNTDGKFKYAGTAFFVGRPLSEGNWIAVYLVTAKHVIEGIKSRGATEVSLRLNLKDGIAKWVRVPLATWHFHPSRDSVDVAVLPFALHEFYDHQVIPISMVINSKIIKEHEVGVGDEVFITGLFRLHPGQARNIPIVRVGNIAAMDHEKVDTKYFGSISAYLIEARSIGGLSGSPVFVNLGVARFLEGAVKFAKGSMIFLLGLAHGHYDVSAANVDISADAFDVTTAQINMGIAIVIPSYEILEVLDQPVFRSHEIELLNVFRIQAKLLTANNEKMDLTKEKI